MLKETLKWLLLVGLTVGLFGCHGGRPLLTCGSVRRSPVCLLNVAKPQHDAIPRISF